MNARLRSTRSRSSSGSSRFLVVALFGIFGDYTLSNLDASSVGCSIFTAAILAIWNCASTRKTVSAERVEVGPFLHTTLSVVAI